MYQFVLRALKGTDLVSDADEMSALWDRVLGRVADLVAFIVMPDHIHVYTSSPDPTGLLHAACGYARWRNARRGETGAVWRPMEPPSLETTELKIQRDIRYIALNCCRAGLATDPLAWPMSLYRDAVGLSPWPLRPAVNDPAGLHGYVSGDPYVRVEGTELPRPLSSCTVEQIAAAVASVARGTASVIRRKGSARRLFLQAARALTHASLAEIGTLAGVRAHAVQRVAPTRDAQVEIIARIAGDPRFVPLPEGDFWQLPAWRSYAMKNGIFLAGVSRWRWRKARGY